MHVKFLIQGAAEVGAPGLVNFIAAVAYHFFPSLPAAFTQPGASTLADLCIMRTGSDPMIIITERYNMLT